MKDSCHAKALTIWKCVHKSLISSVENCRHFNQQIDIFSFLPYFLLPLSSFEYINIIRSRVTKFHISSIVGNKFPTVPILFRDDAKS